MAKHTCMRCGASYDAAPALWKCTAVKFQPSEEDMKRGSQPILCGEDHNLWAVSPEESAVPSAPATESNSRADSANSRKKG